MRKATIFSTKVTENSINQFVYADFLEEICSTLEADGIPGLNNDRIFLRDNLSVHTTRIVYHTMQGRPNGEHFCIVLHPPYWAAYTPIEYKICDIVNNLYDRIDENTTNADLSQLIRNISAVVGNGSNYDCTFAHCGYDINGVYPPNGYEP